MLAASSCHSMGLRHDDCPTATVLETNRDGRQRMVLTQVQTGRCDMGLADMGKIGYTYGQETRS
jgi:hypothetical protein